MREGIQTSVPLAPLTTFRIGGLARVFIEAHTDKEVEDAITYARESGLQIFPLGAGSNVLVPDAGVNGVVLKISPSDIEFKEEGDEVLLIASAGTLWEKIVDAASDKDLFGIENLAGIPGTIGGASVQNIGAYGAELRDVFEYADVIDSVTSVRSRVTRTEALFGYRTSFFKTHRELVVTRVALRLSKISSPNIKYPDLAKTFENGTTLNTSSEISAAVRAIRAAKFPLASGEGTAGSFFKNPIVDEKTLALLRAKYPDLPVYPVSAEGGSALGGKISLAWLLDKGLSLKGFSKGNVRLYEKQPLVIVASAGATFSEVDAFARDIAERVLSETGIAIEREVEIFGVD